MITSSVSEVPHASHPAQIASSLSTKLTIHKSQIAHGPNLKGHEKSKVQFCSHTAWKEFNTRKPRTPYNLDSFETLRGKIYTKICWPCLWTSIQWDLFKAGSHHSCIFSCLGARAMLEIFCSCSAICVRTCTCVLKARHTGQSQTEHIKYMSQSKPLPLRQQTLKSLITEPCSVTPFQSSSNCHVFSGWGVRHVIEASGHVGGNGSQQAFRPWKCSPGFHLIHDQTQAAPNESTCLSCLRKINEHVYVAKL